jgi:hypothetical protein
MTINDTYIEKTLKSLLLKNLKFNINNKTIRHGKFILFKQNHFFIELMLETKQNKIKKFEIPIPFKIESYKNDNLLYCDYRLTTLADNNKDLKNMLYSLPYVKKNKFYDKILEIEIEE